MARAIRFERVEIDPRSVDEETGEADYGREVLTICRVDDGWTRYVECLGAETPYVVEAVEQGRQNGWTQLAPRVAADAV